MRNHPLVLTLSKWIVPLSLISLLTILFWNYTQDDVFITYVYSRNVVEGNGFVFNLGEHIQGTTTPLYTLLMAGVYLVTNDLLHAGNLLSAAFLFLALAIAAHTSYPYLSRYARLGFGVLGASSGLVYVSFGMETLFYSLLLMLTFYLWFAEKRPLAMLSAAALTWTRADGVVLGVVLVLVALWEVVSGARAARHGYAPLRNWRVWWRPIQWGGIYTIGIAPWYLFAWAYFGSPLPNTFGAKQDSFGGLRFWSDGWNWFESFYSNNPLAYLGLSLALIGLWVVLRIPKLRPIGLWAVCYAAGYTVLNTTAFWYYTPWVLTVFLLVAFGAQGVGRTAIQQGVPRRAVLAVGIGAILMAGVLSALRAAEFGDPPGRVRTYVIVGQWIDEHTPDDSTLTIGDLGIMGYHARRYTLDSPGLIVPEMYFKTDAYAVAKYKTDLVVGTGYYTWVQLTAQEWFKRYYQPLAQFSTIGDEFSPMTLYQRRYPLAIPQTVLQGLTLPLACEVTLPADAPIPDGGEVILSQAGQEVFRLEVPFLTGQYPEDRTPAEEVLQEQHLITLPASLPSGDYQVSYPCGVEVRQAEIIILAWVDQPEYQALNQPLANGLTLVGGMFPAQVDTWSGGAVNLQWTWQTDQVLDDDLTLFVHLTDSEGRVWAQSDGVPRAQEGVWSAWPLGQPMMEQREILLPPDLPAGAYQIRVGLYNWRTEERLPLDNDSDFLTLPIVIRNQWAGGTGLP